MVAVPPAKYASRLVQALALVAPYATLIASKEPTGFAIPLLCQRKFPTVAGLPSVPAVTETSAPAVGGSAVSTGLTHRYIGSLVTPVTKSYLTTTRG